MLSHLALPREGHLDQLFHMFVHLKKYHNAKAGIQLDCAGLWYVQVQEDGLGFKWIWTRPGQGSSIWKYAWATRPRFHYLSQSQCRPQLWYHYKEVLYWFYCVPELDAGVLVLQKAKLCGVEQLWKWVLCYKALLWVLAGPTVQAQNDGNPYEWTCADHWWQPVCTGQHHHPGFDLEEEVIKYCLSLCPGRRCKIGMRTLYINTHQSELDLLTKQLPNGEKHHGFVNRILHHVFATFARIKRR